LNPLDPKTGKATRVGRKETENANGKKVLVRYSKKSGEEIK
jgi:large subunit ribosomal protein L24